MVAVGQPDDAGIRRLLPDLHAWVGDAVYELYVRTSLAVSGGGLPAELHNKAVAQVRAEAQAAAMHRLWPELSASELEIVKRARNHAGAGSHRGDPAVVHMSTAFEALLGYLYLTGQWCRLSELLQKAAKT